MSNKSPAEKIVKSRWGKILEFRKEYEDNNSVNFTMSPEWNRDTYEITLKRMTLEDCRMVINLLTSPCFSCDKLPIKYETGLCEQCHQIAMRTSEKLEKK